MKKNDVTYEYRVFTNRLIDVEHMEVGNCTRKVIDNLKSKDKVDGRFFHTSDSNEWFFCWNGELQELNLSGDASVNEALDAVKELIKKADAAVAQAQDAVTKADAAAESATNAADKANTAVESIGNKADKSDVVAVTQSVESLAQKVSKKADQTAVESLAQKVEEKADKSELAEKADASEVKELADKVTEIKLDDYALKADVEGLATETFVGEEIAKIVIPNKVSAFENDVKYLTVDEASSMFAPIGSEGGDMGGYATKQYVDEAIVAVDAKIPSKVSELENDANYLTAHQDISGKQDVIIDLETIRKGAAAGAVAEANAIANANSYTNSKSVEVLNAAKTHSENLKDIYDAAGAADAAKNESISYADAKFQEKGDYALKTEIPSTDNFATKQDVADAKDWVNQQGFLTEETLKNSTVISDINSQISKINTLLGDVKSYITDTILA